MTDYYIYLATEYGFTLFKKCKDEQDDLQQVYNNLRIQLNTVAV